MSKIFSKEQLAIILKNKDLNLSDYDNKVKELEAKLNNKKKQRIKS